MRRCTWLFALLLAALCAQATPLKPDVERMIQQQKQERPAFIPARAGWNGPEAASTRDAAAASSWARFSPQASARAMRATLRAVAIPDPRALVAIAAAIFVLRWLRGVAARSRVSKTGPQPVPELQQAA